MTYSNPDRYYTSKMSSSCSIKSDESDNDFDMDDNTSATNSSSTYSLFNCHPYTLNDKRHSRNQNEKKRRDQFNSLIHELGGLLNHPRKIDKTTVLNETLLFFRNYNEKPLYNKEIDFKYKPFFLQNDEFMRFMIEFQNAFCLVFDLNGQIKYVSDHILHLLGHYPKNVQGKSLCEFIDEKSVKQLKDLLKRKSLPLESISFDWKFKKGNVENNSYESIKIKGSFKRTPNSSESIGHFNTIATLESFLKVNQLFPRDNNKREFVSEFSMDLKYISLDSKASEIIGFMPIEVLGTLIYDYCNHDDLEKLIECHQTLLQNGAAPVISYRYRTKGNQWLWIKTRFEMLNSNTNCKKHTISAHNKVLTLNEMLECSEVLDNSSTNAFNCDTSTNQIIQIKPSKSNNNNNNNNSPIVNTKSWKQSQQQTPYASDSGNFKEEKFYFNNRIDDGKASFRQLGANVMDNASTSTSSTSASSTSATPTKIDSMDSKIDNSKYKTNIKSVDILPAVLPENSFSPSISKKNDQDIDESLESIFLKSFTDIKYRNYVLNQFRMKKAKIENAIRKHQEELKILEETMENIIDEKKLAKWALEFQRQQAYNNPKLQQNNQQPLYIETLKKSSKRESIPNEASMNHNEKSRQHHNHHHHHHHLNQNNNNNQQHHQQQISLQKFYNTNQMQSLQQQSTLSTSVPIQLTSPAYSIQKQQHNQKHDHSHHHEKEFRQFPLTYSNNIADANNNDIRNDSLRSNGNNDNGYSNHKFRNHDNNKNPNEENPNKKLKSINVCENGMKLRKSETSNSSSSTSSEFSRVVGDLINLQNSMPNTLATINEGNASSGSLNLNDTNQIKCEQRGSNNSLHHVNFDIEDDINPEMIDKLFNQYTFDSFTQ